MKAMVAVVLLALLFSAQAMPSILKGEPMPQSPEIIKDYIVAFFTGLDLYGKVHPSQKCVDATEDTLTYASAGIYNFQNRNWYDATLNISDSLGALSPLARQCDGAVEELTLLIEGYPHKFKSLTDFFIKLALNTLGNIKPLLDRTLFVKNEVAGSGNTTAIIQTIGEILNLEFSINKVLKNPMMSDLSEKMLNYTWTDPLAPSPVAPWLWNIFEGGYNLLTSSKLISSKNLVECQGATLNMVLYSMDANNNFQNNNEKGGILSVVDSFTFLHQAIEGCTNTAIELAHRSALIDEEVLEHPSHIWKNFVHNILYVFSDGTYGYAAHYYTDIISLMDAIGDFFYRTITYSVESP